MAEKLLEEIERRLNAKTIHDLRQVARAVGVPRPADGRKERILEYILQIAEGTSDPVAPAVRGAHPKSAEYDRQLVADILRCREISLSNSEPAKENAIELSVGSGVEYDPLDFTAEGILSKEKDKWFICGKCDVFVNAQFVERYKLREGDFVSGKCKRTSAHETAGLVSVNSVNGTSPESVSDRPDFEQLTPVYPDVRLHICCGEDDFTGKIIDLFSPLAKGQRAVVAGAYGVGKTTILKNIAKGIIANNPEVKVIFVSVDSSPEEATDIRRTFSECDVFASSFEAGAEAHVKTARLALEYSKRQVETGKDVVLVLDDLSDLTRAYNSSNLVSSELTTSALNSAKKFLAGAKNAQEGASLTILTALNSSDTAYGALKNLFNMHVALASVLTRSRLYPPIDIDGTYSLGDERLLSEEETELASKLRGKPFEEVIGLLKRR